MDDVAWGALTLTLTALGGVWTAYAFRNRGVASGVRGLGITLVPLGLLLTNSLRMVTRVVDAVGSWAGGLAWNPLTWIGLIVLGMSVTCFVVAGVLRDRQLGGAPDRASRKALPRTSAGTSAQKSAQQSAGKSAGKSAGRSPAIVDDDMAEIEALLRERGIS